MLHNNTFSFNHVRVVFFFSILIMLAVGFLYLIRPFIYPIFWASIIAVIFYPLYNRIIKYIRHRSLSSFVTILLIIALVFLPIIAIGVLTVNQSMSLYRSVSDGGLFTNFGDVSSRFENLPIIGNYFDTIKNDWSIYAQDTAKTVSLFLYENLVSLSKISIKFIFMLFIMTYTLFYFFKDGEKLLKNIMYLSPLGDKYEKRLFERFTSTVRATIKGTFIIGAVQGFLGGMLFWATGIPGALVWGLLMTALSSIPAVGSFIIWLPAGLIMLALGNTWQGIVILVFGSMVIGTIDNLLRPSLVGKDIEMHPLMVLFATLGGIFLFGITGFIIGPIIAALFLSLLSIYDLYYKKDLKNN